MQLFKNNAVSTLTTAISDTDTVITVATGTGDRFPEITTSGDYFLVTLVNPDTADTEIVKVTVRNPGDDSMQIERAQEGTTAKTFPVGTIVSLRVTAGLLEKLHPVEFVADYNDNLAEAINTIGSNEVTLLIDRNIEVNEDITVPANICLEFTRDGKITVNIDSSTGDPYTLTINGSIKAGLWQIFDGDGTIAGSPKIEVVYPEWFGAKDGSNNDHTAINKAQSLFNIVKLQGNYSVQGAVWFKDNSELTLICDNVEIEAVGGSITDYTVDLDTSSSYKKAVVVFGQQDFLGSYTTLASDANFTDTYITVNDTSIFEEGDYIIIWNPTDYSFSEYREYYRDGEINRILSIDTSTNTLLLEKSIISRNGYKTTDNVRVYKYSPMEIELKGKLKVINNNNTLSSSDLLDCIDLVGVTGNIEMLEAENFVYHGVGCINCYDLKIKEIKFFSERDNDVGNSYGFATGNCQEVYVDKLIGYNKIWSAFSCGGGGQDGSIPNRFITLNYVNVKRGDDDPGLSIDPHGNIEYFYVHGGEVEHAIGIAGNETHYKDLVIKSPKTRPYCVYESELLGYSHSVRNCTIINRGSDNPSNRYIIDLNVGGHNDQYAKYGGNFIFENLKVINYGATPELLLRMRVTRDTSHQVLADPSCFIFRNVMVYYNQLVSYCELRWNEVVSGSRLDKLIFENVEAKYGSTEIPLLLYPQAFDKKEGTLKTVEGSITITAGSTRSTQDVASLYIYDSSIVNYVTALVDCKLSTLVDGSQYLWWTTRDVKYDSVNHLLKVRISVYANNGVSTDYTFPVIVRFVLK